MYISVCDKLLGFFQGNRRVMRVMDDFLGNMQAKFLKEGCPGASQKHPEEGQGHLEDSEG